MALLLYFLAALAAVWAQEDTLQSVLLYWRHGDRSPENSFPTDPYFTIEYWPMGFEELLSTGVKRHYELGKWLRNRYSTFLPDIYNPNDTYVFSTDRDRTLMSALANLAGLYPPVGYQLWNPDLLWQPIPVHTIPRDIDPYIMDKRDCDKYDELKKEVKNDDYFTQLNEDYADFFKFVSEKTGLEIDDIKPFKDIYSTLYVYQKYNDSYVPDWAWDVMDTIRYLAGEVYERDTHKDKMKRFRTGPFFHNLFDHFENAIDKVEGKPKLFIISGHETGMTAPLNAMGVYDYIPPDFASVIIWELKSRPDGSYYVNVLYKTDAGLKELIVEGCSIFDCDYDTFKDVLDPFTCKLETWQEECDDV